MSLMIGISKEIDSSEELSVNNDLGRPVFAMSKSYYTILTTLMPFLLV